MVTLFNLQGPAAWHLWVPALAQTTLMGRVLKGEPLSTMDVLPSVLACLLLGVVALAFVARTLRTAAVK
jgi:sodium transport system permease protein